MLHRATVNNRHPPKPNIMDSPLAPRQAPVPDQPTAWLDPTTPAPAAPPPVAPAPHRPRFTLTKLVESIWNGGRMYTLHFTAATGAADRGRENSRSWWFAPSGTIELACLREEYAERFVLGETYYLDLTTATPDATDASPVSDSIPCAMD